MTPSKIASVAAAALMTLLAADVDHGAAASTAEAAVRVCPVAALRAR